MATPTLLKAKLKDGTPVEIKFENCGDCLPVRDADGIRYEVYSSHFICDGHFEIYSHLDKRIVDALDLQDGWLFRMKEDFAHLDRAGVDIATIEDEYGPVLL